MARPLIYAQRRGLVTRIVDGEAFVITRTTIQHLNPAATAIWLILEQKATRRAIAGLLATLYPDVDRATLGTDLDRTLALFTRMGITRIQRPSPRSAVQPD